MSYAATDSAGQELNWWGETKIRSRNQNYYIIQYKQNPWFSMKSPFKLSWKGFFSLQKWDQNKHSCMHSYLHVCKVCMAENTMNIKKNNAPEAESW